MFRHGSIRLSPDSITSGQKRTSTTWVKMAGFFVVTYFLSIIVLDRMFIHMFSDVLKIEMIMWPNNALQPIPINDIGICDGPGGAFGRNNAIGSVVLARSFCARASSFAAHRSISDMLAAHSSSYAKICFAITSFPTALVRPGSSRSRGLFCIAVPACPAIAGSSR